MMSRPRRLVPTTRALALLLLLAGAAPAPAPAPPNPHTAVRGAVPLPAGWTSENGDEGRDDYSPPPPVKGIYAHGHAGAALDDPHAELCKGDEAAQARVAAALDKGETEFWFYATAAEGVLFARTASVAQDRPCAEALTYDATVSRAYVADGRVHSFEVTERGDLSPDWSKPLAYSSGVYAGSFNLLHNLMARRAIPGKGRLTHRRVAGVAATCATLGGLVWSSLCIADGPRPIAGMIVSAHAGDDERESFTLEVERVKAGAVLDARVFEPGRRWWVR
ncbi:MAG: hypothetical protein JO013_13325 [Alphaproteobacteria bacterium]|nr:hypothetical protein [Alphaproteobacteria bacterium]